MRLVEIAGRLSWSVGDATLDELRAIDARVAAIQGWADANEDHLERFRGRPEIHELTRAWRDSESRMASFRSLLARYEELSGSMRRRLLRAGRRELAIRERLQRAAAGLVAESMRLGPLGPHGPFAIPELPTNPYPESSSPGPIAPQTSAPGLVDPFSPLWGYRRL